LAGKQNSINTSSNNKTRRKKHQYKVRRVGIWDVCRALQRLEVFEKVLAIVVSTVVITAVTVVVVVEVDLLGLVHHQKGLGGREILLLHSNEMGEVAVATVTVPDRVPRIMGESNNRTRRDADPHRLPHLRALQMVTRAKPRKATTTKGRKKFISRGREGTPTERMNLGRSL